MHMLSSAMRRIVPESSVVIANDPDSLASHLDDDSVLLVNRVLDGAFETERGSELIRELSARANPPVMLLISNFESAQAEAVAAGARPGFGKSQLYQENTVSIMRNAVARQPI
jgi:two-component system, chemotaxis family, chemotaxis protein CheY